MEPKGNSIELSTFLKYGLTEVISHKTVETGGKMLVNYVWCKVCAKFVLESSSNVEGSAKTSACANTFVVLKKYYRKKSKK